MDKALEAHLEQVTRQLRWMPPAAREAEMREVEDHLRRMIEAQQAQGFSYSDAVGESIRRFGDAKGVGKALARAWHKRQPERMRRAVLAFIVALVGQYFFLCGAIGFAGLVWPNASPGSLAMRIAETLLLPSIVHLVSGFLATVIAPRRGQAAVMAAYLAIIVLALGIVFLPALDLTASPSKQFASFSFLFFDRIVLTVNFLLIGSILNVTCGNWLAKNWIVRRATHQQFENLQSVGDSRHTIKGDGYGS